MLPEICLGRNYDGAGGIAGGAGAAGQASNVAAGKGVSGRGFPMIEVTTSMKADLHLVLYANVDDGEPEDLSPYTTIKFMAKETLSAVNKYIEKDVTIEQSSGGSGEETGSGTGSSSGSAPAGRILLSLVPADLLYAGIWVAAFVGYDSTGSKLAEWRCYLCVNKGLDHTIMDNTPITVAEMRMVLRDVSPSYNTLIDDLEFSDSELAFAITRPIDEWNEYPVVIRTFTPATFPWREMWRKITAAYLLETAAVYYMRNSLNYSAGGMGASDKERAAEYKAIAQEYKAAWKEFMTRRKVEDNANQCYGTVGSRGFRGMSRGW